MRTEVNEQGYETIVLEPGDAIGDVPAKHRELVHAGIHQALIDPVSHFRTIASRTPYDSLRRWLNTLTTAGRWELELNLGWGNSSLAGFYWRCEGVSGALIGLPDSPDLDLYPSTMQSFYVDVDVILWNCFGCAGGLVGATDHKTLSCYNYEYFGADMELATTHIWGRSDSGDMLVYTEDDRGGWVNHETGHIHLLGSVADTINWVFERLLANDWPEYDPEWERQVEGEGLRLDDD